MEAPLEKRLHCICGECEFCQAEIARAEKISFKLEGRAKLRLAEKFCESIMKRAVMDAQDHCLIEETTPNQTLDYYLAYLEVQMSLVTDAIRTRHIQARKNLANDPNEIAKFKQALLARREASGKKAKAQKEPKEKKISEILKYKTDDAKEKQIITALFQAHKSGILSMAFPMIVSANPDYKVSDIAKKMGLKI